MDVQSESGYESTVSGVHAKLTVDWVEADQRFMRRALELARQAESAGEVPVGAVIVREGLLLGEGWNQPISSCDPTSHAELGALREASARVKNYRFPGSTLYVTLEPCVMCAGAIVLARIDRVVFAARDLRFGAVRSKFRLADSELLNHRARIEEGLFAAEASELLLRFFRERRGSSGSESEQQERPGMSNAWP